MIKQSPADDAARFRLSVLLSADELRDQYGLKFSRVQLWQLVRDGKFPAPIKISAARSAWVRSEIEAFIESKKAER